VLLIAGKRCALTAGKIGEWVHQVAALHGEFLAGIGLLVRLLGGQLTCLLGVLLDWSCNGTWSKRKRNL